MGFSPGYSVNFIFTKKGKRNFIRLPFYKNIPANLETKSQIKTSRICFQFIIIGRKERI